MARFNEKYIENESAYEAAIARNIAANRRKTGMKKWVSLPDYEVLGAYIHSKVNLVAIEKYHPGKNEIKLNFIDACYFAWEQFGCPSDKMIAALRTSIEKDAAHKAEFKAKDAEKIHVGVIGERSEFDLTVSFVTSYETHFNTTFVHGFRDADGNIIIHKGTSLGLEKGQSVKIKATVKEHSVRDGVKQTIITRPKVV